MTEDSTELRIDAPTVLLIDEGERFAEALRSYLHKRQIYVEIAAPAEAAEVAFVTAPDLIVLAGDASQEQAPDVLAALAAHPMTATMPVAMIADQEATRALGDLKHGLVAVVQRSASADEMARRVAELAEELPDRKGETMGELGADSLDELVELLAESLRSGVLTLEHEGGGSAQILLRADRPVDRTVAELVARLRPLIARPGQLRYEFQEAVPSRLSAIEIEDEGDAPDEQLGGRRLLVVEQDPARSDLLAQDLRRAGATVAVIGGDGGSLELARELQPEVVVVDGSGVEGWAVGALRAIRRDPWLRWASVLLVDAHRLWRDPREPDIGLLAHSVTGLVEPDRELAERAKEEASFGARLETLGPIRMLRALAASGVGLRVRVQHPRVAIEVDVSDGLVAGARATARGEKSEKEGFAALATLLGLAAGRVTIKQVVAPRSTSVMAPVDAAIRQAAKERPLVAPSIPPPSIPPKAAASMPAPGSLRPEGVDALVGQLEGLLTQLKEGGLTVPPPSGVDPQPVAPEPERSSDPFRRLRKRAQSQPRLEALKKPLVPRPPKRGRIPPPKKQALSTAPAKPAEPAPPPPPPPPSAGLPPPPPAAGIPRKRRRPRRNPTLLMGSTGADPASEPEPLAEEPTQVERAPLEGEATAVREPLEAEDTKVAASDAAPEPTPPPFTPPPGDDPDTAIIEAPPEREAPAEEMRSERTRSDPPPVIPEIEADYSAPPSDAAARIEQLETVPPRRASPPPLEPRPLAPSAPAPSPPVASAPGPLAEPLPEVPPTRSSKGLWIGAAALALLGLAGAILGAVVWARFTETTDIEVAQGPTQNSEAQPGAEAEAEPGAETEAEAGAAVDADPDAEAESGAEAEAGAEAETADADPDAEAESGAATEPATPDADGPIEGREGDLDLAALGVDPVARPRAPRARHRLAVRLVRQGNQARRRERGEVAERRYLRALGYEPDNARAIAGLARVHLERETFDTARLLAQRLCRLRPNTYTNWLFLGDIYRDAGDPERARSTYQRAVELAPGQRAPRQRLRELDR